MGIALIVKNANFEQNKVATVEFNDVQCTGLSIDSNAYTVTSPDTPVTVVATVTPNDCTDALIMAIADTSIATIENGIITPVGIGSTTLTVTCGTFTVTATVTVPYVDIALTRFGNYRLASANYGSGHDPLKTTANSDHDAYAAPYEYTDVARAITNGASAPIGMVILAPANATSAEVHYPGNVGNYGYLLFANARTDPYNATQALYISKTQFFDYNTNGVSDSVMALPANCDAVAVEMNHSNTDGNMFVRFTKATT